MGREEELDVLFVHRKARKNFNYSLESYFDTVRAHLPSFVKAKVIKVQFHSNGILRRIYIMFEILFRQHRINHITGDINFAHLLLPKKRNILTMHDVGFLEDKAPIRKFILKLLWLTLPVHRAQIITVISQATKKEVLKLVNCDPNKIRVIYVSILDRFKPGPPKEFNKDKPRILHVGTKPNKNLTRLIESLKDIPCVLDIVGVMYDHDKEKLAEYNIEYENSYNITDEEVVAKYQNCDLVAFVSTYEGFGMPIVEANACGKPVITSNLLSMPEVAGDAACIIDPYDLNSIKNGILKIINDEEYRALLVKNGLENVKRFRPDHIANQYVEVYKELVE